VGAPTILLATRNPAKEAKLRWLLRGLSFAFATPREYPSVAEPEEDGTTHRHVAAKKALFWSERASGLAIASDGGARVPALGVAWDSLLTRRAAGIDVEDRDRADHLLGLTRGLKGAQRSVVWVEGLALARGGELLASWEVEGALGRLVERYDPALIRGGFWMGGLLYLPRFGKVYAQLDPSELERADICWNELRRRVRAYFKAA